MSSAGSSTPDKASSSDLNSQKARQLVSQLKELLPELRNTGQVPATLVLEETCNHIKTLEKEVGGLRERIDHLLANVDRETAATIRRLLGSK
ncbi:Transcription factor [Nymphaea thermarum]|nr:Transcription factor [Nymphaea thermarum]